MDFSFGGKGISKYWDIYFDLSKLPFSQYKYSISLFVLAATKMGKTADLTAVIETLHEEVKPQKVITGKAGCFQSAVLNHYNGKLTAGKKCGRKM